MMKTCIYGRSSDCRALPPIYYVWGKLLKPTMFLKNFKKIFQKVAKKWATILGNEWLTL